MKRKSKWLWCYSKEKFKIWSLKFTIWSFFVYANTEKFLLTGKYMFFNHWTNGDVYDKICTYVMYVYNVHT